MPRTIFIVSQNTERQTFIKNQLTISFPAAKTKNVHDASQLNNEHKISDSIIVFDSESSRPVPSGFVQDIGGYWLNLAKQADDTVQIHSLIDGFSGCMSLEDPVDLLPRVIRCLQEGQIWYSRQVIAFAIRQYQNKSLSSDELTDFAITNLDLTHREKELTKLLIRGKSNQEIADQLCISIHTVKTHVSRILSKLNVHSRNELNKILNTYSMAAEPSSIQLSH
ncbi:transcriptional regulator VpsT [Vibrio astriarenae]|nr:transcriptional regulator VpsT [Vibrio sp. C7]